MEKPDPIIIKETRLDAGLTITESARLVHMTHASWAKVEADYDAPHHRNLHPGIWELYQAKLANPKLSIADLKRPTPTRIKRARIKAGLTQTDAAALIKCKLRQWQYFEADGETGKNFNIHLALWELFLIKCGQLQ